MKRLEEIAQLLEDGDQNLEESLVLYEEGIKLAKFCSQKLDEADKKLKLLTKKEDGFQLELSPLDGM